ncbi:MAG: extracellular solute-binding protein [Chloroflexi bacterium]|nr:extracellular solute-binding protein [Chloroflexota bacterium]
MKYILLLVILLALIFNAQASGAQDDEVTTIIIWGEPGTVSCIIDPASTWEFCNYVRELDARWQAEHPDIEIVWEDHGWDTDLFQALQAAIEEGTAPDITVGESFMPQLVQQGHLIPVELPPDVHENIIPATATAVERDGVLYGVPVFTAVFTLEINADLFLLAGLDPNTIDLSTWDQIEEAARVITEAGAGEFYGYSILGPTDFVTAALFRAAPYLYQVDAPLCNMPVCDTPSFNHPNSIQVYEWFRRMSAFTDPEITFAGSEAFVFSQLFSGITAMQTAGSWHPFWAEGSGCFDCRYLPLPLPPGGNRANVVVGNPIYGVLSSSEHPEEATEFLKYMIDDQNQSNLFWTGVGGRLPTTFTGIEAVQRVMEGDTSSVPSYYTEFLGRDLDDAPFDARVYDVFIDELLNGDVRTLPSWSTNFVEVTALWNEMFTEILSTDRPISEILDDYQAQAEALMSG